MPDLLLSGPTFRPASLVQQSPRCVDLLIRGNPLAVPAGERRSTSASLSREAVVEPNTLRIKWGFLQLGVGKTAASSTLKLASQANRGDPVRVAHGIMHPLFALNILIPMRNSRRFRVSVRPARPCRREKWSHPLIEVRHCKLSAKWLSSDRRRD